MSQQPIHLTAPSGRRGVIRYSLCALVAATLLVGVGCSSHEAIQTPPPSAYQPAPYQPATKKVEIVSEPAGARIEVNGDYIGDAPITVENPDGSGQFTKNTVIRALPTEAGDYV
jgi:PEGA domain-containing protein